MIETPTLKWMLGEAVRRIERLENFSSTFLEFAKSGMSPRAYEQLKRILHPKEEEE